MTENDERQPLLPYISRSYADSSQWRTDTSSGTMDHPPVGISQQQLIVTDSSYPGRKTHQYLAALAATLGALASGTVLGWAASANIALKDQDDFTVTDDQISWIGSLATLGAACICMPIGYVMNKIGRKLTMLLLAIPFVVGWVLLATAVNVPMLMIGRFIVGLAGGAFCVTAPTYTSEIAQDSIRGTLGTFFQLLLTVGILLAYAVGGYASLLVLNIVCGVIPIVFAVVFFFMPETPYYLITKNRLDDARKSLIRLRGELYDTESELKTIQQKYENSIANPLTFKEMFSEIPAIKALVICYCVMFFQQFSGINAVLFNTTSIFESAGSTISSEICSIIIGAVQVGATLLSTIVVDLLGRKILLLCSGFLMGVCGIALGVYFNIQDNGASQDTLDNISWLPLVSLCIFIVAFSFGFGPIPWMLAGDLCTADNKPFISSTAGTLNWLLAFTITQSFSSMRTSMTDAGAFWFFSAISLVSVPLIFFFIPETKGKSVDEIQAILRGDSPNSLAKSGKS